MASRCVEAGAQRERRAARDGEQAYSNDNERDHDFDDAEARPALVNV
jgi:hypothetical protein